MLGRDNGKYCEGRRSILSGFLRVSIALAYSGLFIVKRVNREISTWRRVKHKNIAEFLGIAYIQQTGLSPGMVSRFVLRHDFMAYVGKHPNRKREMVYVVCLTS